MSDQKIDAIFMEGTTSCFYYTGMRWGQRRAHVSVVVIPANGAICYVAPGFEEEPSARNSSSPRSENEVRVWQEHESPYALIAGIVKDRGVKHHRIGVEERVRFFIADGIRKAAAGFRSRRRHAGHRGMPRDQIESRDRAAAGARTT